jgi:hypothetical protein
VFGPTRSKDRKEGGVKMKNKLLRSVTFIYKPFIKGVFTFLLRSVTGVSVTLCYCNRNRGYRGVVS